MTDVVVAGAGAAGLMAAATAARRGLSVLVVERARRIGQKILISGGGRCNFTNRHAGPENYLSSNPDFCKSALARYRPDDFIALVERHGIRYHEKKLGQLFCDGSSREIVALLQRECDDAGATIRTDTEITGVTRPPEGGFRLGTSLGSIDARQLVVATGGLSLPKLGATDFAFRIARQFGITVLPPRAGLVPFTFTGGMLDFCRQLSGVSAPCLVSLPRPAKGRGSPTPVFAENFLFTHRGLSGPAVLQASSYWQPGETLHLDLLPGQDAHAWLKEMRGTGRRLDNVLARILPQRLADAWASAALTSDPQPLRNYSATELESLGQRLQNWELRPAATEGYATAEVTVGGIDTRELHSRTMEARAVPGLHFVGEAVDVTGWLGGYNFQWAWASGHACGEALSSQDGNP